MMKHGRKTNLFIVGAAKAGTTMLYQHLSAHPQICMSSIKEPNYFSSEGIKSDHLYYKEPVVEQESVYSRLFNPSPGQKIIGEASVSYLFYPGTAEKIFSYNPETKIVIILRDPVRRAFSPYLMDRKLGLVPFSFDEVVLKPVDENKKTYFQQYVLYGLYFDQVRKYMDVFPAGQVRIFLFDSIRDHLPEVLSQMENFLGLSSPLKPVDNPDINEAAMPSSKLTAMLYRQRAMRRLLRAAVPDSLRNTLRGKLFEPPSELMSAASMEWLRNYYLDDLCKLERLIQSDLKAWYE